MSIPFILLLCITLSSLDTLSDTSKTIKTIKAVRVTRPPVLDGYLTDECWEDASIDSDFVQIFPFTCRAVSSKTIIKVGYDEHNLYVAFISTKPRNEIRATRLREDTLGGDDCVILLIDSYNDKRRAYLFAVNPLNVQVDGRVDRDGRLIDLSWDGVWQSGVSITDSWWTAEFAIPFDILHFKKSEDMTWGINFERIDYRNDLIEPEWSTWSNTGANPFRVSKFGEIEHIEDIDFTEPLNIMPYGRAQSPDTSGTDWKTSFGGDIEHPARPDFVVALSFQTDNKWIESQQDRIVLMPFEEEKIFLKEKRYFFLDDKPLFYSPVKVINTRSIDDVKIAWRTAGRAAEYDAAYLSIETSEKSEKYSFIGVQTGFWEGSTVSWFDVKKQLADSINRAMSVYVDFSMPNEFKSRVQHTWNLVSGESKTPGAFFFDLSRKTNFFSFDIGYKTVAPDYRADIDYVPETEKDRKGFWLGSDFNFRLKKMFVYKINPFFSYHRYDTYAKKCKEHIKKLGLDILFKNRIGIGGSYEEIKEPLYNNFIASSKIQEFYINYNRFCWTPNFRISYQLSKQSGNSNNNLMLFGKITPFRKASINFAVSVSDFKLDKEHLQTTLGATYKPKDKWIFRFYTNKKYGFQDLNLSFLVEHKFAPGNSIFLGYTETRETLSGNYKKTDYAFIVKLCLLFVTSAEKWRSAFSF